MLPKKKNVILNALLEKIICFITAEKVLIVYISSVSGTQP